MATMNISLPDQMKAWVEEQTQGGRYGNASDYVRDLIRRDQERKAGLEDLQAIIDNGMASGVSEKDMAGILLEARRRVRGERS